MKYYNYNGINNIDNYYYQITLVIFLRSINRILQEVSLITFDIIGIMICFIYETSNLFKIDNVAVKANILISSYIII